MSKRLRIAYFATMYYRFCTVVWLFSFLFAARCEAQGSSLACYTLQLISSYQLQNTTTKGNFPSYITNRKSSRVRKPDDNVFFAALTGYLLRQNKSAFSAEERSVIDSIQQRTKDLYPHFRNQSGRLTYNFWRTDTSVPFRYTKWIRLFKKNTSLPDDMDDTVLSLMAQDADSATAAKAHLIMQAYVNNGKKSRTIEKNYRPYKAYSAWYGKNFPPVFDVCVLCNILSFVQQYHLAWTSADSASLDVIVKSIKSGDYKDKPLYVSPYYGNPSIILYHLARLMERNRIPELDSLKTGLVANAAQRMNQTNDLPEKVMLSSAMMKWGYDIYPLKLSGLDDVLKQIEISPLPFFTGNIPSYFPPFYKHLFTEEKWLLFYHYSPAFNDALLLEYLSLVKQNQPR